jgi:hypothetical protein
MMENITDMYYKMLFPHRAVNLILASIHQPIYGADGYFEPRI